MHPAKYQLEYFIQYFKERSAYRYYTVENKFGSEVASYLSRHTDMADPGTEVLATSEPFNIKVLNGQSLHALVNLKRVNDIGRPNEFFSMVNEKLPQGGCFIGCFESIESRRRRLINKYRQPFTYPFMCLDFLLKRIFPKMGLTRKIYRLLTRNENRTMSRTETMGRLISCGFEIVDCRDIGYLSYFVCKKTFYPVQSVEDNYGFFIKLKRVGKEGKLFNVYKLRTMHPYAEYLQGYVYKINGLNKGDKITDDFRVTSWGRILRKLWIDEQPMWINLFKGDVKLVGVRPLSEHKLSVYPEELRLRRVKYKPGLIPPFYVDLPETKEEFFDCENKYLDACDKNPWLTDFKYFWRALFNILLKCARSS